jgi:phospholipase C
MPAAADPLGKIKRIVVLMLENRSFDNVLGYLYDPKNEPPFDRAPRGQSFEGVSGKKLTNPVTGGDAEVTDCVDMVAPHPNPNEAFADVYCQMYNVESPLDPSKPVPEPSGPPSMQGFANNYGSAISAYKKAHPGKEVATAPGDILKCYRPESLPVISGLANAYAVCDHWFSSVPTETFPNRSFVHSGTSSGRVYNDWTTGKHKWDIGVEINHETTIFNLLEESGLSWGIYHGESLLASFAFLLNQRLQPYASLDRQKNRFFSMDRFYEDARSGRLPSYSFIEPRYFDSLLFGPQNDMHPSYLPVSLDGPSNLLNGERLIYDVYEALRGGPGWPETLFIITFDEHGGCYDHVPPPAAEPPDGVVIPHGEPGGSGFKFDRLGVRVPAVIVSPLIEPGTISNGVFDHTSIIKTVINCFGLKDDHGNPASLGNRVRAAKDVGELITRDQPRDDTPKIEPLPLPGNNSLLDRPLSRLHKLILQLAGHHRFLAGEVGGLALIETTHHAVETLEKKAKELISKILP